MIKEFKDYSKNMTASCDVCVIGSGAGGAVAAKELSEKGFSVILLEEGGNFSPDKWNGKPFDSMMNMWRNGGSTVTLGTPVISVPLGKCIGGTTAINSCTCFRTPDNILTTWQNTLGLDNLTKEAFDPYFSKVEKEINVTELSWDLLGNCGKIIKRGADKLGLNCNPLKHNVKDCKGCGTCQFGCIDGAKQSMDTSYVPKAIESGAGVYANCRADKLIINNKQVTGVSCAMINPETGKKTFSMKIRADAVVVACGSMITPSFLRRNGLKNYHIGRNLQIHPCARVAALMDETVEGWKGVSQGAYIDDFEDEGIMLEGIFVHPSILLAAFPGIGHEFKDAAAEFSRIAAFGVMVHDSTTGRVLKSSPKWITATYFIQKGDVNKLQRGVAHTARIYFAAGAKKVFTPVFRMPVLDSENEVEKFLGLDLKPSDFTEIFAFHPLGTCRMASNSRQGVVGKTGETFEVENLFIADGSIVPTSLGVNPQVTIMALATMVSEGVAEKIGHDNCHKPVP